MNQLLSKAHLLNLGNQGTRAIFTGTGQGRSPSGPLRGKAACWAAGGATYSAQSASGRKPADTGCPQVLAVAAARLVALLDPAHQPGLPASPALRRLVKAARPYASGDQLPRLEFLPAAPCPEVDNTAQNWLI